MERPAPPFDPHPTRSRMHIMTAYWISIYKQITDEAKVAAYAELAGPALRDAGGTYVARGLPEQTYEAGGQTRTVVIAFESVDAARAAHDSPAYQDALSALDGGAVRDMRIVPGADGLASYGGFRSRRA